MLDITPFLKEGKIAEIKVGMTFEDFEDNSDFGYYADDEKHLDPNGLTDRFSIFEDELEYRFIENKLNCISISAKGNYLTILDEFQIGVYTTLEKFLIYLDLASINWEFQSKDTFGKQLFVQLESGVEISYIYQLEDGFMLSKLQQYSKFE
jgi:hypothetical protein